MKCSDCIYSIKEEFGWSNWTVEGAEIDCLLRKNPNFPSDNFYGEAPELLFANTCDRFKYGSCIYLDCDLEDLPLDPSMDDFLKAYGSPSEEVNQLLRDWFSDRFK